MLSEEAAHRHRHGKCSVFIGDRETSTHFLMSASYKHLSKRVETLREVQG